MSDTRLATWSQEKQEQRGGEDFFSVIVVVGGGAGDSQSQPPDERRVYGPNKWKARVCKVAHGGLNLRRRPPFLPSSFFFFLNLSSKRS